MGPRGPSPSVAPPVITRELSLVLVRRRRLGLRTPLTLARVKWEKRRKSLLVGRYFTIYYDGKHISYMIESALGSVFKQCYLPLGPTTTYAFLHPGLISGVGSAPVGAPFGWILGASLNTACCPSLIKDWRINHKTTLQGKNTQSKSSYWWSFRRSHKDEILKAIQTLIEPYCPSCRIKRPKSIN